MSFSQKIYGKFTLVCEAFRSLTWSADKVKYFEKFLKNSFEIPSVYLFTFDYITWKYINEISCEI